MKCQIVSLTDGGWSDDKFDVEPGNVVAAMTVRGFVQRGWNMNPRVREELRGLPTFEGLSGPMWNGDGIRYENTAANRALSI